MPTVFKEKPKLLAMGYYEQADLFGGYFVKDVVENIDYLFNNINILNSPINSVEEMNQYFWCLSFKKMAKDVAKGNLDKTVKNRIKVIADSIKDQSANFVKFVNANYATMFLKEKYFSDRWAIFLHKAIELCYCAYQKSIEAKVFRFIEQHHALSILSHYELCGDYYSKNSKYLENLFIGLENTRVFDDQIYLEFLLHHRAKQNIQFLKEKADFITSRSIKRIKELVLKSKNEDIITLYYMFAEYKKLATLYKTTSMNEYNAYADKIHKLLDDFILTHGVHKRIGPLDFTEAIKKLKEDKNTCKYIFVTHVRENDRIVTQFNKIYVSKPKNKLEEDFNEIDKPSSERYPHFKQVQIETSMRLFSCLLDKLFQDKDIRQEFGNYIYSVCLQINEKYFNNDIKIDSEILGSFDMICQLIDMYMNKQHESMLYKAVVNGCCVNLCGTIEKILRNMALKEELANSYLNINFDKIGLGKTLSKIVKLKDLSPALRYVLEYVLIKETDFNGLDADRPGLNMRNDQMHNKNEKYEHTYYGTCLDLFFLVLSLINELFLVIQKK